jgi:tagatose-6-phosphate ketose/aldose isomerase
VKLLLRFSFLWQFFWYLRRFYLTGYNTIVTVTYLSLRLPTLEENQMSLATFVDLPVEEQKERGLFFTPREIAQQPETWKRTFDLFQKDQDNICRFLEAAGVRDELSQRPVVWLIGAGTSDYIGQSLALLLREKWGCEVSAVASTDLLPNLDAYIVPGRKYLWISFSRSGDSPEGVAVLERAAERYPEIAQLIVTCNAEAQMAAISRQAKDAYVITLEDAVNDRSLVMTSSFTNMVVLGQCLAHAWSLHEYSDVLAELVRAGQDFLPLASETAEAVVASAVSRVCFVGSGTLAGVAQESALKVLEMTAGQVKSMSETILGLRHGPMAALDTQTLFVCFVSGDEARAGYAFGLLAEIGEKQVVRKRIAIGPRAAQTRFAEVCDLYVPLEVNFEDAYRPPLDIIFGQLLGLYSSVAHQLKPDSPSADGVINRVVAKFEIH